MEFPLEANVRGIGSEVAVWAARVQRVWGWFTIKWARVDLAMREFCPDPLWRFVLMCSTRPAVGSSNNNFSRSVYDAVTTVCDANKQDSKTLVSRRGWSEGERQRR